MKLKHLTLIFAGVFLSLLSSKVYAQAPEIEEEIVVVDFVPEGKTYYYSPLPRDNWFMSMGAGVQTLFAEHKGKSLFSLSMTVDFGKWFNPYWGLRLSATGGALRLRYPEEVDILHYKNVSLAADFMWNMTNTIGGYDPYRIISVIPYVGFASNYAFKNPFGKTLSFGISTGMRFNVRLCRYADMFVEGKVNILSDNYNGVIKSKRAEATLALLGGISFNFGGKKFASYNPVRETFVREALNAEINTMRSQDNTLAQKNELLEVENTQLKKQLAQKPKVITEKQSPCDAQLTSTVRFALNSSVVTDEEMINIYNIAEWMKANPTCDVIVTGYADKETGTDEYNKKLSEQRANKVIKILVKEYNIDESRLKLIANGSSMQPYPNNNSWNRVVVFKSCETK
ncbi:MAG: OmpA family protein [Muribaculaceae bacterium]|nr:OmpA family protein [Muribaculaceae bacterium]